MTTQTKSAMTIAMESAIKFNNANKVKQPHVQQPAPVQATTLPAPTVNVGPEQPKVVTCNFPNDVKIDGAFVAELKCNTDEYDFSVPTNTVHKPAPIRAHAPILERLTHNPMSHQDIEQYATHLQVSVRNYFLV